MKSLPNSVSRSLHVVMFCLIVFALLGAGDEGARFNNLGHRLMCVCGCNQILLECNHVGCTYSDRMRGELMAGLDRGENDDLTLQDFVQKYGPTVLAAPTATGFNRVAWVMPFLALALGLLITIFIVTAWKGRSPGGGGGAGGIGGGTATGGQPGLDRFRDQVRKDTEI
jgi:cytochrome c-type biogenesis protein CcmH